MSGAAATSPIVPVLDLRAGRAVHAVGGDRRNYRPLRSRLHAEPDPIGLARAVRDALGLRRLYLADLDAIAGARPSTSIYETIAGLGLELWVDAGLRGADGVAPLRAAGVDRVVAGLESLAGPDALEAIVEAAGADRLVFSLDLRDGRPIVATGSDWEDAGAEAIARIAVGRGVRRLLLLDLARVGRGGGVGTRDLLARLAGDARISVGGGIGGAVEVRDLVRDGAEAVLVGSALHDGRIGRDEVRAIGDGRSAQTEAATRPAPDSPAP